MQSIKEILEEREQNNILTDELKKTLKPAEEYIKDEDIYCKNCHTRRTCLGFRNKVRCICQCQAEALKAEQEAEKRKAKLQRIERLRSASLLGERYKNATFANTEVYNSEYEKIFNRCKKYTEVADAVLERGIGIYLYGDSGTGKSHLTACMANKLLDNYYSVLYTNFSEISKTIRGTFDKKGETEQDFLEKLATIDFLFIDDFGTEMVTRNDQDLWLQEKVFDVINKRYNNNRPIIFTSNYSLAELMKDRGVAGKTVDRITEVCEVMRLKGKSYRTKAKAKPVF